MTAGKQGVIYVTDRKDLGKFHPKDQVVQRVPADLTQSSPLGEVYGAGAYYNGSLYYLARGAGSVFRIQYPANQQPPNVTTQPLNQSALEGQSATFSVNAGGTAPLSFQWQRNDANIPGANTSTYSIPTVALADNGARFRCVVSNAFGSANSNEATLTVTTPPPTLFSEANTDRAIAFDSVMMMREQCRSIARRKQLGRNSSGRRLAAHGLSTHSRIRWQSSWLRLAHGDCR